MTALDDLRVLADWGRDTTYSHPLSDLSGRVIAMEWGYGFTQPGLNVAPPAGGQLTLDNTDGAFSVGKAGGAYAALLRRDTLVKAVHRTQGYTFIQLRIAGIRYAPGQFGQGVCVLTLADWQDDLVNTPYDPPLTLSAYTGDAIVTAFRGGKVGLPYASRWWIVGASRVGIDTRAYDPDEAIDAEQGKTLLPYAGDNTVNAQGGSLAAFIQEMTAAEMGGRFYYARTKYRYLDRQALAREAATVTPVTLPATALLAQAEYSSGDELLNAIDITCYPRRVGAAGTELWRSESPYRIAAGETRTVTARYRDPEFPDGTCAATTIITPVASTDYTANAKSDGSGADLTSALNVTLTNRTNAAEIQLSNSGSTDLFVTLLKVRGTPLTARAALTIAAADAQSIHTYSRQPMQMTLAGVGDTELVQQYADYLIKRRKDPITRYRTISFAFPETAWEPTWAVAFPGDVTQVRIHDPWLEDVAGTRTAFIAGARHTVNRAAVPPWAVTYALEDAAQSASWVCGHPALSIVGVSTVPAF